MFIPIDLKDAKERAPVSNGKYDLTVQEVDTEARTKEGKPQWILSISIDGHELTSPNVRHYIGIPSEKDTPEQRSFKVLNIARFNQLFGISADGLDSEAMIGAKATGAELVQSEPDEQGRRFNRLVLPYLRSAGQAASKPSVAKPPKR